MDGRSGGDFGARAGGYPVAATAVGWTVLERIAAIWSSNHEVYGRPRIHAGLQAAGAGSGTSGWRS